MMRITLQLLHKFLSLRHLKLYGKGWFHEKKLLFFWILSKLPPPPNLDNLYNFFGQGPPPLIWTKSIRTAVFSQENVPKKGTDCSKSSP